MSFLAQPYNNPYFSIEIMHVPTKNMIAFDGFVTNFVDSFNSEWNETSVYGRMDPLATFQRTGRKIQLAFDVVARSAQEARLNDAKLNRLIQFLYPVYDSPGLKGNNVMTSAPVLRLKWANMIRRRFTTHGGVGGGVENSGLLGYLRGLDYTPQFNAGTFLDQGKTQTTGVEALGARAVSDSTAREGMYEGLAAEYKGFDAAANPASAGMIAAATAGNQEALDSRTKKQKGNVTFFPEADAIYMEHTKGTNSMGMYPQQIAISLAFSVIHEHLPGWAPYTTGTKFAGTEDFPHGTSPARGEYDSLFGSEDLRQGLTIEGREQTQGVTTAGNMLTNTESNQITRKEFEARVQQITGEAFQTTGLTNPKTGFDNTDFSRGGRRYFSAGDWK